ncbi:hypothetical protein [Paraburkholderia caribensis]|uniref:hypothetical protein n=1 Tax=Paraburkholderia caribensis TaxID=75105 RepID=UPI00158FBF68|nr:hypothetical protein [Paraburkholderia caribensis]
MSEYVEVGVTLGNVGEAGHLQNDTIQAPILQLPIKQFLTLLIQNVQLLVKYVARFPRGSSMKRLLKANLRFEV